jgi:hypothetical protein
MQRQLVSLLLGCAFLCPLAAGAVTDEDFRADTTQNLLNLCTATPDDPRYGEAIHFCHGYLLGAFHYYRVTHAAADSTPLFCFPDPPLSRNEAVARFVTWAKGHHQYLQEVPVETEFRFLTESWPCP